MSSFSRFRCFIARFLPPVRNLGFPVYPNVFLLRLISSRPNQQSFTVSYLVKSLRFPPQSALSASKRINFDTPDKPDKTIDLFRRQGFTQSQLSSIFQKRPTLLLSDVGKTILPKLEFLETKGFSYPEIAKLLSAFPIILCASLANQIVPTYDFFRKLFGSDEDATAIVRRFPGILVQNVEKYVSPNIAILQEHGVPYSNIITFVMKQPKSFLMKSEQFREIVERVEEMGFDAKRQMFVKAVFVVRSMSKSRWEAKVEAYKKWGWSEGEVLKAFKSCPTCMTLSEDKITETMLFFIEKMGLKPCHIAKCPVILTLSLERRVVPRYSVFEHLLSKGLVKKEVRFTALFIVSEERFLQKYVVPYGDVAPELMKTYKKFLDLSNRPRISKA